MIVPTHPTSGGTQSPLPGGAAWHGLVAWRASVLAQRRVHVSPGPYSSIWELMLADKLEPRILGSWVPVRGRRTVRAEVSGPASGSQVPRPSVG